MCLYCFFFFFFFFFKQKTAYEMVYSDWSSDVCSSDLGAGVIPETEGPLTGKIDADPRVHGIGTGNSFSGPINGGLKVGVVSQNVSVFVAALEGITDTSIVANPKVLVLNKQKGSVH